MEITEITNHKMGNLYHTFGAYIQRRFYNKKVEIVYKGVDDFCGKVEGTVRVFGSGYSENGSYFDIFWDGEKYYHVER